MATHSPPAEWRQYWAEMELGCRQILRYIYIPPMDEAAFYQNKMAFEAVLYNLERIYKAAQSLPEDVHPWLEEEDWRTLASFKEVAANAQFGRHPTELWTVADEQIPGLLASLRTAHRKNIQIKRHPRRRRRGRSATTPWQLSRLGWRDIGWRVWDQFSKNNVSIVSAGVAFYGLLAIFPILAALVSIYGLLLNPADVESQLTFLEDMLPVGAWTILKNQLHFLASQSGATLSISAAIGFLLALWSARMGTGALMTALNIVYKEEEKRSLIRTYITALLLTLGGILFSVAALSLLVVLPALLSYIDAGLGAATQDFLIVLRWPLLAVGTMFVLTILYRFGPSRRAARWEWLSIGAVVATLLWMLVSWGFSFYVAHFGSYNETYGSLGAVVILMLWFWLTAMTVLIGAELNAEMEHQTKMDTTTGRPKPMGKRNAYMADNLGRRP